MYFLNNKLKKSTIKNKDKYIDIFNRIFCFYNNISGKMYLELFFEENAQLFYNSIILFEKGFKDCAFYSLRQIYENNFNLIYVYMENKFENWNSEKWFPDLKKVKNNIRNLSGYHELFFEAFKTEIECTDNNIKKINKMVHKQGLHTFYANDSIPDSKCTDWNELFYQTLKNLCFMTVLSFIFLEPLSVFFNDYTNQRRFDMPRFLIKNLNLEYFDFILPSDFRTKLYQTKFYNDIKNDLEKKPIIPENAYEFFNNGYLDLDDYDDLLDSSKPITDLQYLSLLLARHNFEFSKLCSETLSDYIFTNIDSHKRSNKVLSSSCEYKEFHDLNKVINHPWKGIFVTIISYKNERCIIEHNNLIDEQLLMKIVKTTEK